MLSSEQYHSMSVSQLEEFFRSNWVEYREQEVMGGDIIFVPNDSDGFGIVFPVSPSIWYKL